MVGQVECGKNFLSCVFQSKESSHYEDSTEEVQSKLLKMINLYYFYISSKTVEEDYCLYMMMIYRGVRAKQILSASLLIYT